MTGTSLAHYHIDVELGRGGMGIVYRATDTKLDRTVALKILPPHALSSEDDRARFFREAKAAAQLHHQHIATVFEISEAIPENAPHGTEPRPYIAMEYVDGFSLADRIAGGPLKLDEAVRIATQATLALGAAHEAGIVHRDVKSGNIMLTSKGEVKVLDFGLAKTAASTQLTRQGSTLGTIAYMSPEQARGDDVDRRTDLWALGVVIYEMIAGRLPFSADYEQAALYGILNEDPEPLTAVRTGVPMGIEWIVTKLLAKRAADRYQNADDLLVDLRTVDLSNTGLSRVSSASKPEAPADSRTRSLRRVHPGFVAAAAVVLLASAFWLGSLGTPDPGPVRSTKRIVQPMRIGGVVGVLDISPNGDRIAFATDAVRVLDLTTGSMRPYQVPGSYVHADFSEDGAALLLTSAAGIERMDVSTGSVIHVIDTREGGPRAEWVDENTIVFEEDQEVHSLSLTTGETRQVIAKDPLIGLYDVDYPYMLPDGETLVATAQFRNEPDRIGFWDLESGRNLGYIHVPGNRVQWDNAGHLVFTADGNAMAMPFDPDRLEQTGPLFQVDEDVRPEGLSVSREGTIIHVGDRIGTLANSRPIVPLILRFDGASAAIDLGPDVFPPAVYRDGVVHPDGRVAAVVVEEPSGSSIDPPSDIWILDFETGTRRALTRGGTSDFPAWSVTGDSLFFMSTEADDQLMVVAASGRGGEQLVYDTATPSAWDLAVSPNGTWAAYATGIPPTMESQSTMALWRMNGEQRMGSISDPAKHRMETPNGNPRHFAFSPDSKYVAYEDQGAIFVQALEDLNSTPYPVFENSMNLPRWAPDGSKLYALRTDGSGVSIQVQTEPVFRTVSSPVENTWYVPSGTLFDVLPSGDRILVGYSATGQSTSAGSELPDESVDVHFIFNLGDGRH